MTIAKKQINANLPGSPIVSQLGIEISSSSGNFGFCANSHTHICLHQFHSVTAWYSIVTIYKGVVQDVCIQGIVERMHVGNSKLWKSLF